MLIYTITWINFKILILRDNSKKKVYTMILFIQKSRKCKPIYSDRKQMTQGGAGRRREGLQKDMREVLEVINMFTVLIVVMVYRCNLSKVINLYL